MKAVGTRFAGYRHADGTREVADRFSNGMPIGKEYRDLILAHESATNDADAVLAEFRKNPVLARKINTYRFTEALRDMDTDDARVAMDFYKKYRGTEHQELINMLISDANRLIESGEYETPVKRTRCKGGYSACIF